MGVASDKDFEMRELLATLVLLLSSAQAFAWGYTAHHVIAEIAEQFLGPQTVHKVRALLEVENVTTLAEVSTWADEIRTQHPETAPWHYVDIPIHPAQGGVEGYDRSRDCPHDDCVVAKVVQFEGVLSDQQLPDRQRLEALKYIVHFLGDLHQPLHVSNDNDRGGNEIPVTFMGQPTNLHAVWDTGIIEAAVRGDERGYAIKLAQAITPDELARWTNGDPVSWANEGYRIAVSSIYNELPHSGTLPDDYEAKALPIVNQQIQRAGVRLAKVLNEFLN
jgi:nuclease S1